MYAFRKMKPGQRKAIAIFFALLIVNQFLFPCVALALTAGPTAPEATNFEPVDTTDMVNPLTGDFTYSMPLLEVPGPEGGYPLALAYHAGIQPNEEASWVGLGWTLNPGAIARNVNGYADDWNSVQGVQRTYWSGGNTKTFGVDVGIGEGPVSVNFGLSFAQDTYKGFGVGYSLGATAGMKNSPFRVGVRVDVTPYGQEYVGTSIGIVSGKTDEGLFASADLGISTNFKSVSAGVSGGINVSDGSTTRSLLGASIGSNGRGTSGGFSVGGASVSVSNANAGKIQTESSGFGFTLPLPGFSVGVSYNYERYWSDETATVSTNGALHNVDPSTLVSSNFFDNNAFDTYRLLNDRQTNIVDNPDPDRIVGGTYPSFDDYVVTAQGLSGNIRPYAFQNILYNQNKKNNQDPQNDVVQNVTNVVNISTKTNYQFRFIKDFSNKYTQDPSYDPSGAVVFDTAPKYGEAANDGGYNSSTNQLEGSRHIEYFTNQEIADAAANPNSTNRVKTLGFLQAHATGFVRNHDGQIGGFMITNESGVTYHYALPAYSSNELVHTEKVDQSGGYRFNDLQKTGAYAYTWYLTAITGPDYVDVDNDGQADNNDWGYWVSFEYGKWTGDYTWRNPSEGFHKDLDNQFQSYSTGKKEVYYLDAAKTRTHTALFVKEIRADGKSLGSNGYDVPTPGRTDVCPRATLRLNNILLLQNDQFTTSTDAIRSASTVYDWSQERPVSGVYDYTHFGHNIIDIHDIEQLSENLNQKCLRRIQFNYDYSLCPGVVNSYDPSGQVYSTSPASIPSDPTKLGKSTLLSVDLQGKGGAETIPPVQFEYDLDPNDVNNTDILIANQPSGRSGTITAGNITNRFQEGDILTFTSNNVKYYCTLLKDTGNGNFNVLYLDKIPTSAVGPLIAYKTKNPPYNKDAFDLWGAYKSDYIGSDNENLSRITTKISNLSADVWSLRKIKSSIGAEINVNYEGDTYNRSVLNDNKSLVINSAITKTGSQTFSFSVNNEDLNINNALQPGGKLDLLIMKYVYTDQYPSTRIINPAKVINSENYGSPVRVQSLNGNVLTIKVDPQMDYDLTTLAGFEWVNSNGQTGSTPLSGEQVLLAGGNVAAKGISLFYGGGIRVKNITVDDLAGQIRRTNYDYGLLGNSGSDIPSGVTSYQPVIFDVYKFQTFFYGHDMFSDPSLEPAPLYKKELYKKMNSLLVVSREVPPPGVMYENVTVSDEVLLPASGGSSTYQHIASAGKTTYEYEVFSRGMLGIKDYYFSQSTNDRRLNTSIKDYTARIGNLKRMITYDDKGNKLTEKINHYLHDDIADKSFDTQVQSYEPRLSAYNNIGVIQERYADARTVYQSGIAVDKRVMSGRDVFPAIMTGTTQIDYKNGTKTEQQDLSYDFYSGAILKTRITDSYGNKFINEVLPAYHIYPAMGLKTADATNKHMLIQQAASTTFKVDGSDQHLGVVSASANTWSNQSQVLDPDGNLTNTGQSNIWRMKASYAWMPSGTSSDDLSPTNSFQAYFDPGGSGNSSWKKVSELTLYNVFSKGLEQTDINNNYSASRLGYNNTKVIMTGNFAKYNEIAYSGAEDEFKNNTGVTSFIAPGDGVLNTAVAHTGTNSLTVHGGNGGFNYSVPLTRLSARDYYVAVWVKAANGNQNDAGLYYKIGNGASQAATLNYNKQAAGWYLLEMRIPKAAIVAGTGNLQVGCVNNGSLDLYFDDFRFQPVTAAAKAYVYDKHTGELSYILDNSNLYLHYEYDAAGRLTKCYKEVLGKTSVPLIKSIVYHYSKMQ
ncbi:hypothetical protein C8P68_11251 [Mucilaginibacter yixingensis]|uniref:Uncharacterized protein n=1 Tax=Mucilaginibacter yixingensis TaxID=1295612 RepID=A0A2T5J4M0_9SPHI|nr:hypothetical protein [Mucilaginibacter yixingensis]PTQ92451.1 hypothetical protein C8P68_11251 [Mucilaginibacter yixingensis]